MTESRTSSCKIGTRCHICTGCGRCFGDKEGMQVITGSGLNETDQRELLPDGVCQKSAKASYAFPKKVIAVDIGTTTIAMVLYDSMGQQEDCFVTVNPQVKYGADVLSRIQAAEEPAAAETMKREVREVLVQGIRQFRGTQDDAGEATEYCMFIAANTTMVYLLVGLDPAELGRSPFFASHLSMQEFAIEGVKGIILPGLSAFVGADIVAGIYACGMAQKEEITLLIDLGTNGEMAIGSRKGIIACSTAAGPAFEGGATRGVWGADMVHLTAELLRAGILDETGLMAEEYFEQGILIGNTLITQKSIRDLQLAKAAIAAGIGTLAEAYGLESMEQIDRVVLAGGFGYYLQAEDAAKIGLLPAKLVPKVISGGNTALAGIRRYLLTGSEAPDKDKLRSTVSDVNLPYHVVSDIAEAGDRFGEIVKMTRVMNLAEQDAFQDRYIDAMYLEKW